MEKWTFGEGRARIGAKRRGDRRWRALAALAGALGLVQGASFAAVPQLNATAAHQSQAYGAVAQTGNLGNTLGTPVMLAVLGVAGYSGLIWMSIVVLALGFGMHTWMAARRNH